MNTQLTKSSIRYALVGVGHEPGGRGAGSKNQRFHSRRRERSQPFHRDAGALEAPDDAVGRARYPGHVGHDASLRRSRSSGAPTATGPAPRRATRTRSGSRTRNTTRAMEAYHKRVDPTRQMLKKGNVTGAFRSGGRDLNIPQRQTNLIFDPPNGMLPPLTPLAKTLAYKIGSDWALPGENIDFQSAADFDSWDRCVTRGMPSMMMPYRYNGGFKIHQAPGYVVFDIGDDPRSAHHPDRRQKAARLEHQAVSRRVARPLGGHDAGRGDHQLPDRAVGQPTADEPCGDGLAGRQPVRDQRQAEDDRADRASQRRHVALRNHDRGPRHPDRAVHGALPDAQRPELFRAGVRVPRGQRDRPELRDDEPLRARESDARSRLSRPSRYRRPSPTRWPAVGSARRGSRRSTSISRSSSRRTGTAR